MQLPSQWLIDILKVLSFRLLQCFDLFSLLSVSGSSETLLFKHLPNHFFRSRYFRKYISYEGYIFCKCLKFRKEFRNAKKISEKFFFLENSIWIGCVKVSLLSRQCLSLSLNVLTNSLRILCIIKRDFFQCNYLHSDW